MDALLDFWFNPKNEHVWFTPSPEDDKTVTDSFGYLIDKLITVPPETLTDPNEFLAYILTYDQVSRHVSRFFGAPYPEEHLKIALKTASHLLKLYPDLEPFITTPKRIPFVLLPYRHTKRLIYLKYVKTLSLRLLETTEQSSYVRRFYQATIKQIGKQTHPTDAPTHLSTEQLVNLHKILDPESTQSLGPPRRPHPKHPLLQAIRDTLPVSPAYKGKHHEWRKIRVPTLTLSVSGGKDSMALATALKYIQDETPKTSTPRFNLQAVHINYTNRSTSKQEEDLVTYYVSHILEIPLKIRRITEINRNRTSKERKFYEEYTKTVRFRTYNQIQPDNSPTYVVLGHNHDDTIENIITNITKKQHYDNLLGMKTVSTLTINNTDTKLYRPLLSIPKSEIEDFNRVTGTPFTYDSTPSWSDRGRLRDSVIPALRNFKPSTLEGLTHLSETVSHLSLIYSKYALPAIIESNTTRTPEHITISYDQEIMTEKVLRDIFSHYKLPHPAHKSLKNLIQTLNRRGHPPPQVMLSKSQKIMITPSRVVKIPLPETC